MIQLKEIKKDISIIFFLLLFITTILNVGIIVLNNSAKNDTDQQGTTMNSVSSPKTVKNLSNKQASLSSSKNNGSPLNLKSSVIIKTEKNFKPNSANSINALQTVTSPITINGNTSLASNANSGTGTSAHPYIIENLSASLINPGSPIITIENTNAYFILRNNTLSLTQSTYAAIKLNNVTHGIFENNTFNADTGIEGNASYNNIFANNTITNSSYGFYLTYSNNNTFSNNSITGVSTGVSYGFYLSYSNSSYLINNSFSGLDLNPSYGIYLYDSIYDTFSSNNLTACSYGFYLYYSHINTFTSNSIAGISGSSYGFYLYYSNSSTFISNNATNAFDGFHLSNSYSNTFTSNNATNNFDGFYLESSNSNTFTNNNATNNFYGFYLTSSSLNNFIKNGANGNTGGDFYLDSWNYNNLFSNNTLASKNSYGFYIYRSNSTIMTNNSISNENYGLYMYYNSSFNIFANNTLLSNTNPIYIDYTSPAPSNNQILTNTINGYATLNSVLLQSPTNGLSFNDNVTLQYYADLFASFPSPPTTQSLTIYINNVANTTVIPSGLLITNLIAGQNNITLEVIDGFGNIQTQQGIFNITNTIAPVITITSPTNTTYFTTLITMTYSVTNLNLKNFTLYEDSIQVTTYASGTVRTFTNDVHNFTIVAFNTAGNRSSLTVIFTVNINTPVLTFSSPTNNSIRNTDSVTVDYSAFNYDSIEVFIDHVQNTSSFYNSGFTLAGLSDGLHNITIKLVKTSPNKVVIQELLFTVDTTKPSVSFSNPTNTTYTSSNIQVVFTTSDVHLSKVVVYINGVANTSVIISGNAIPFKNGYYNLTILAVDSVGNYNNASVYFTVNIPLQTTTSGTQNTSTNPATSNLQSSSRITANPGFELFGIVFFILLVVPMALRRRKFKK